MLATALLLLPASCIKDDYAARESTTVTLSVSTRSDYQDQNNQEGHNLEPNEEMKTLRVIVARSSNNEIIYNEFEDNIAGNDFQRTFNFSELTIETDGENFDFYAIANEASFGGNFIDNYVEGESLGDESALLNYQITADANTLITNGLPAAGKASHSVTATENQSFTIEMQRAVAKARVNFINETGTEQTITDVKLLKVGAESTVLFPISGAMNYTPNDQGTVDLELGDVTIAAPQGTKASTSTGYFYESQAPDGGYVLQATWNGNTKNFSLVNDMTGGSSLQSAILRNKFLNITITLKANDWKLDYEIIPWEDNEVSLDFTDILTYTSAGWTRGTYLALQDNTVHLNPDMPAELKFTINAPNGALWRATLEGDVNAFEFVDGINSGSAYTEGAPVEQTIKVKVTAPESDERYEATLRVFADIGGKTYELDLTNPEAGDITPGEDEVINNRFTLLQSR